MVAPSTVWRRQFETTCPPRSKHVYQNRTLTITRTWPTLRNERGRPFAPLPKWDRMAVRS